MLGIIGGSGLYKIDDLDIIEEKAVSTPFGNPSAPITIAKYKDTDVAFLPRHGKNHEFLPSEINFRANIFALKNLGVDKIISVSAVGSLREDIEPGDLVIPDQYFDHTRGKREASFFGNGLAAHVSTAEPICSTIAKDIISIAEKIAINVKTNAVYACVEGPRLGTKAESNFLRSVGCDVVGMTNIPEVFLAREAQISYCSICVITDYDCWLEDPEAHVNVEQVMEVYMENIDKVIKLLKQMFASELRESPVECRESLKGAIMTPENIWTDEHKEIVRVLMS